LEKNASLPPAAIELLALFLALYVDTGKLLSLSIELFIDKSAIVLHRNSFTIPFKHAGRVHGLSFRGPAVVP